MCECTNRGYTTLIGIEKFNCNLKINKDCGECVKISEKIANEYLNKILKGNGEYIEVNDIISEYLK